MARYHSRLSMRVSYHPTRLHVSPYVTLHVSLHVSLRVSLCISLCLPYASSYTSPYVSPLRLHVPMRVEVEVLGTGDASFALWDVVEWVQGRVMCQVGVGTRHALSGVVTRPVSHWW